ncbi:type II toxin-antitoxin system RelE/ParE family toxin [Novosphingobium sp. CF614]|uniref:type II toxin-antitoxin system RelE/ParE family toxin n=1 Tax=Novosphingobium sp. CF614 TaxID=1884364 RepID=UPI000B8711CD|nr:type II toxin-antitoxin system RelE/ParE family toxin [Novosphingobium sp. CF614]
MKLFWTVEARQDRRDAREHIANENPVAALALDEMFTRKARNLLSHPALGRPGRMAGTRELIVHRNYLLVYDVSEQAVRILRVLHARRRWPPRD